MKKAALAVLGLAASQTSLAGTYNYAEVGFGLSKLQSESERYEELADSYNDADPSIMLHLSTGGRIGNNENTWLELTYLYDSKKEIGNTSITGQGVLASLKLTTSPLNNASVYAKLGGGKYFSSAKTKGEKGTSYGSSSFYQGAFGVSFRLDHTQAINVQVQTLYNRDAVNAMDNYTNSLLISLNHFI